MAPLRRQLEAFRRNALTRPGADDDYANGDDSIWMGIDWPTVTRRLEIGDRPLAVVDTGGDGPPLLFIHGLSGNWQNWLYQIPALMGAYRVIAPDLPGFGASALPAEPISMPGYGRTVAELLDALEVGPATVVGNSMGGFVAAELAIKEPARVERLALVSPAGLSSEQVRREPLMTLARLMSTPAAGRIASSDAIVRRRRLRRVALQTTFRYPQRISPPLVWESIQGANKPGFLPALEAILRYSFRDRLHEIACPTLIVWGANDLTVPTRDARRFEELIGANAMRVIIDDTGHVPMIERPLRFNALLEEFLAGTERPGTDAIASVDGRSRRAGAPTA